ncbi:MAG: hypothetical protein HQM12_21885 [SAR324 cluster bacterium]|nr:hypothetical protein [SAR324 cluster bacterium]
MEGKLDEPQISSKRSEYIELSGMLTAQTSQGHHITMLSIPDSTAPIVVNIMTSQFRALIFEATQKMMTAQASNGWQWEERIFPVPFQSQLTHQVIHSLLETDDCGLTPIKSSFFLHQELLSIFLTHLNHVMRNPQKHCPVT